MVVADPDATLLTACELATASARRSARTAPWTKPEVAIRRRADDEAEPLSGEANGPPEADEPERPKGEEAESSSARYPTKSRGGMGVRDIPPTATAR